MSDKPEKPNKQLPVPDGPEGKNPYGIALVIAIALSIAAGMLWKSKSTRAGEHA